jgi:hypothetical protein
MIRLCTASRKAPESRRRNRSSEFAARVVGGKNWCFRRLLFLEFKCPRIDINDHINSISVSTGGGRKWWRNGVAKRES